MRAEKRKNKAVSGVKKDKHVRLAIYVFMHQIYCAFLFFTRTVDRVEKESWRDDREAEPADCETTID